LAVWTGPCCHALASLHLSSQFADFSLTIAHLVGDLPPLSVRHPLESSRSEPFVASCVAQRHRDLVVAANPIICALKLTLQLSKCSRRPGVFVFAIVTVPVPNLVFPVAAVAAFSRPTILIERIVSTPTPIRIPRVEAQSVVSISVVVSEVVVTIPRSREQMHV
jgi:hypothetical protein